MQALRNAGFLARLVLAWFALSIGIAVAAPVVKPQGIELICSAGGSIKILVDGDSGEAMGTHTLDCPLCTISGAPPAKSAGMILAHPLRHAVQALPAPRIAALKPPVPPARGPPATRHP